MKSTPQDNPYDVLGIEPDASIDDIKKAYHRQARKNHPDLGGTEEAFAKVKRAADTLLDPELRLQFDQNGVSDEKRVDNDMAIAMQRVAEFFVQSIDAIITSNTNMDSLDLVGGGVAFFDDKISKSRSYVLKSQRLVKQYEKVLSRLRTKRKDDIVSTMLKNQIGRLKLNEELNNKDIRISEMAKEILKDYEFVTESPWASTPSRLTLGRKLFP